MAQNNIFGILSNYNINDNLPAVLDAIRWKETGGEKNPLQAIGSSGEIGAFQLNPEHFSDFGFDVQKNITNKQAQDYWSSRKIASDLLEGMKKYRNYDLGQLLAGYNWGSGNVDKWIKSGGKFEDLPTQTQDYLTKVAQKLQEGYVDPLRTSMLPVSKPQTMLASYNDQGINQNYNNDLGQVDIIYRGDAQIQNNQNPSFWSQLNPIQSAQAAPLNTNTGTNNMNAFDRLQSKTAHENLAKNDGSATLFIDEDGTTYILTGGQNHGIVFDPSLMPESYNSPIGSLSNAQRSNFANSGILDKPNSALHLNNEILDNPNASGALSIPPEMSAGMQTWENYRDQPKKTMDKLNVGNNRFTPPDGTGSLSAAQRSNWNPTDIGRVSSQGFGSAQAATLGNTQSSQSKLPPNPNMTRNNTNLSTPSNSMMVSEGEMLMRMAGAGLGSLGRGSTAALSSALDKYGEIKDLNRVSALELAKAQAEAGVDDDTLAQIGQIDETMFDMNRALGYLNKYNLTGFFTQYLGTTKDKLFGGKAGNTRQAARKLLEKLRVDDTLLRIAQTKGAISNKEMELFLAPSPDMGDAEGVWIQWIQDRMQALNRVRNRMSTGQTVSQAQQATSNQVDQFGSGSGGFSSNVNEALAIVNNP